jgi:hypothetical protein
MFSILNHKGFTSQNDTGSISMESQNDYHQENKQQDFWTNDTICKQIDT